MRRLIPILALFFLMLYLSLHARGANNSNVLIFCEGNVVCPCENYVTYKGTGCRNSTGRGAKLVVENRNGSWDAIGTYLPPNAAVVLVRYVGEFSLPKPFHDGKLCMPELPYLVKYEERMSNLAGQCAFPSVITPNEHIPVGSNVLFQMVYRDPSPLSACGKKGNSTNGCAIVYSGQ